VKPGRVLYRVACRAQEIRERAKIGPGLRLPSTLGAELFPLSTARPLEHGGGGVEGGGGEGNADHFGTLPCRASRMITSLTL
jgi:hypothetical protein